MNNDLLFDFTADMASKTILITREFKARQDLVWDAFTKKELLDRWAAPAPLRIETRYMDFRVGGKRFYAMISPEGKESYVLQEYTSITPKTNFKFYNAFADKDQNPEPVGSDWDHNFSFSEQNGRTTVRISIYNESQERMQRIFEGFRLGFTAMLLNLDELFASI